MDIVFNRKEIDKCPIDTRTENRRSITFSALSNIIHEIFLFFCVHISFGLNDTRVMNI